MLLSAIPQETCGDAVLIKTAAFTPDSGTNEICWEIRMKNGDVLRLTQTLTCRRR